MFTQFLILTLVGEIITHAQSQVNNSLLEELLEEQRTNNKLIQKVLRDNSELKEELRKLRELQGNLAL